MSTVFSDDIFQKSLLRTIDGKEIICTLRSDNGSFLQSLIRNDSKGVVIGRMIEPITIPSWMVPGTVFSGSVNGFDCVLTLEPTIPSRISLQNILGDKVRFSYMVVSEFGGGDDISKTGYKRF
jgi:hypothetical protein